MKPDLYKSIATLAEDYGVKAAAEVAAFEVKHVQAIKEFVDKEGIDCDYTVTNAVDVQLDDSYFNQLQEGYKHLVAGGSKPTANARIIEAKDAQSVRACESNTSLGLPVLINQSSQVSKVQKAVLPTNQATFGPTNSFSILSTKS